MLQQLPHLPVDHHRVEPLLAAEVLVHDGLADPGSVRDLLDGGTLVALLGEQRAPHVEELLAAGRGA